MPKAKRRSKYQIFPALTAEEYQGLNNSIAQRGVDVPIIVDDDGGSSTAFIVTRLAMNSASSVLGKSVTSTRKPKSTNLC